MTVKNILRKLRRPARFALSITLCVALLLSGGAGRLLTTANAETLSEKVQRLEESWRWKRKSKKTAQTSKKRRPPKMPMPKKPGGAPAAGAYRRKHRGHASGAERKNAGN